MVDKLDELRSFGTEQVYAIALALFCGVLAGSTLGKLYVPWAYAFGALYGLLSYECWLLVVDTYHYDDGHKPKGFDWKQACIALTLPCGACIVVAVGFVVLFVLTLWILYCLVTGQCDYAE